MLGQLGRRMTDAWRIAGEYGRGAANRAGLMNTISGITDLGVVAGVGAATGGAGGFATGEGLSDRVGRGVIGMGLGAGAGAGGFAGHQGIMRGGGYQQFGKTMRSKMQGGMTKMGSYCTLRSNKGMGGGGPTGFRGGAGGRVPGMFG